MATFNFAPLVAENDQISACLGATAATKLTTGDQGKAVKLGTKQNYVLCATGEDIEGVLVGLEPITRNSGFAFGTVSESGTAQAEIAAAESNTLAVGAYVVSGIPVARNTAGALMVIGGAGVAYKWRIIRMISGVGASGSKVLIKRV